MFIHQQGIMYKNILNKEESNHFHSHPTFGVDILGPFPKALGPFPTFGGDYFTKWVQVKPLATITT